MFAFIIKILILKMFEIIVKLTFCIISYFCKSVTVFFKFIAYINDMICPISVKSDQWQKILFIRVYFYDKWFLDSNKDYIK